MERRDLVEHNTRMLVLIAGMPGSGKTTFAEYLSRNCQIPLICKDRLKETLWEIIRYDGGLQEQAQKYGALAYDLSFQFCKALMQCGMPLIFESNFGGECPDVLRQLIGEYDYRVVTVLFDGDMAVIHRRFLAREQTAERHPGLASGKRFVRFEDFCQAMEPCRNFSFGDVLIRVDATDFRQVSYKAILKEVMEALHFGQEK